MYASNVGAVANPSLQQHVSRETATHTTCTQAAFLQGVDPPQPLCRLYRQKVKGNMQGQAVFHVKHWPQLHGPQAYKHILSRSPLPPCHFREVFRQRSAMHKSSPAHPALRLCFAAGLQITACAPASDVSRETDWRQSARSVLRTCMI